MSKRHAYYTKEYMNAFGGFENDLEITKNTDKKIEKITDQNAKAITMTIMTVSRKDAAIHLVINLAKNPL